MSEKTTNTDTYSENSIRVLEGLQAVRQRPGMYIGSTGSKGLHHLVYEVIDNSIDEAMAGHCDNVTIILHVDGSVTVEDNGRGIPVGMHPTAKIPTVQVVLTVLHAGGKFDTDSYKTSGGLHGVGVSVVNALSETLQVTVKREGGVYIQSYERGKPVTEVVKTGNTNKKGTKITFKPDGEIFDTLEFSYDTLARRFRELSYLNPGVRITIKDERFDKEKSFFSEGGIVEYLLYLNKSKELVFENPIHISGESNGIVVELAVIYNDTYQESIYSFVNNINTEEGGTHEAGFKASFTKAFNNYVSKNNLIKDNNLTGDDIREGMSTILSIKMVDPVFEGQTKTKLGSNIAKSAVEAVIGSSLQDYMEENGVIVRKILEKAIQAYHAREAARRAKELTRRKSALEGDSAGGSAKQGRDSDYQAILPLRGKILNVEKARLDKILSSQEIRNLITALGVGVGKEGFNPEKLRYHKIIIMTDADVDGAHISTLILTFFFRYMRELIDRGYIYIANPPLYKVKKGKTDRFIQNDDELESFLLSSGLSDFTLNNLDKKKLKNVFSLVTQYQKMAHKYMRKGYSDAMVKTFATYSDLTPESLADKSYVETLLKHLQSIGAFEKSVDQKVVHNEEFNRYNIKFKLNSDESFIDTNLLSTPEIKELRRKASFFTDIGEAPYVVSLKDEEQVTFETLSEMVSFVDAKSRKGLEISRFKGLGEMDAEQLWDTTMDPTTRSLYKVTIDDGETADELFSLLMGDTVAPRREFIEQNALNVRNLDI